MKANFQEISSVYVKKRIGKKKMEAGLDSPSGKFCPRPPLNTVRCCSTLLEIVVKLLAKK